jgi:AraC-like DNA-binding protein
VDELVERAITLTARILEHTDARRVVSGRPATLKARRALVDAVREALVDHPSRSLSDLASTLAVSPHHLSRVFHSMTGSTIARHRMRLRTRAALERLNGGEDNLARIAADVGFADHGHLCRVLRDETGQAPSELRSTLSLRRDRTRV